MRYNLFIKLYNSHIINSNAFSVESVFNQFGTGSSLIFRKGQYKTKLTSLLNFAFNADFASVLYNKQLISKILEREMSLRFLRWKVGIIVLW